MPQHRVLAWGVSCSHQQESRPGSRKYTVGDLIGDDRHLKTARGVGEGHACGTEGGQVGRGFDSRRLHQPASQCLLL